MKTLEIARTAYNQTLLALTAALQDRDEAKEAYITNPGRETRKAYKAAEVRVNKLTDKVETARASYLEAIEVEVL